MNETPMMGRDAMPQDHDLDAFRESARTWLAENFPPSLRGKTVDIQFHGEAPTGDALTWKQRMADKGWRAYVADTVRWRRPHRAGGAGIAPGDGARRGLQPDLHQPGRDHGRPDDPRL